MSVQFAVWMAAVGMVVSGPALNAAEQQAVSPLKVTDIALGQGGALRGQTLDSQAAPMAGVRVQVLHQQQVVAEASSDAEGRFTVSGLRSGAHTIQFAGYQQQVRLWNDADVAPPNAVSRLALVVNQKTVRGQDGSLTPLLVGGGVFTAATAATLATTLGNGDPTPTSP
ncbi:MAG: carboxypeptidase regulatory-like domain-containing protein [Planctomycetaceae bacterium]|nr:carboxypeptidase regulatory-like domain-containing protein [Planctomycetaceae bacterium]MCA9065029.1 carboxypeptidase regulatory-like domain-containing protein [Planctomycetaceae bacterium]